MDNSKWLCHSFLRDDKQPAAKPLPITESREGYQQLQQRLEQLHRKYPDAHIHLRINAASEQLISGFRPLATRSGNWLGISRFLED